LRNPWVIGCGFLVVATAVLLRLCETVDHPQLRYRVPRLGGDHDPIYSDTRISSRPTSESNVQIVTRGSGEAEPAGNLVNTEPSPKLEQLALATAETNVDAALQWLSALPDGNAKLVATRDVAYEAARSEPEAALDLASALPVGSERDALLIHAISEWAVSEAHGAADWALQIEDERLRSLLLGAVATAAAKEHPAEAATLVATRLAGDEQARAAVAVVQRWAQSAPLDAAGWAQQFPEGPARRAALQNLLSIWSLSDRSAATAWLNSLPAADRAALVAAPG